MTPGQASRWDAIRTHRILFARTAIADLDALVDKGIVTRRMAIHGYFYRLVS